MINFLIHRPVSVIVLFVGLLILAAISVSNTELSLLPDLDIPVMIIQVDASDKSPQEVESQLLSPMRRHLLTMHGIKDLTAEAHWGYGEIRITSVYGWDMDKAFIETNEKIDLSLNYLPKEIERPRVIKTRAEDLPSYLLTLRQKSNDPSSNFLELSEFSRSVLRRRLEQLEEIALVDIHGDEKLQIEIILDENILTPLGLNQAIIQQELDKQNIPISSIRLKERNYEYLVQIGNPIHSIDGLKNIKIIVGERVLKLSDLARVQYAAQPTSGAYLDQGLKAISLAIIKTPTSSLSDLKENLTRIIDQVQTDFPNLVLQISRDQTEFLEVTINNLYNSIILGCFLAISLVFFFYRYWRIPVLMAIVIPISLLVTILLFQAFSISINMLSLSGILLGLGLIIDNGIIVLDNISQEWSQQDNLAMACIRGTNEMIRPLLTSMLTTCSVFIPLMFLSGLAGALFWDQAMAISLSLLISFLVSITLLPTLYFSLMRDRFFKIRKNSLAIKMECWYEKWINFFLSRKLLSSLLILIFFIGAYPFLTNIKIHRFPILPEDAIEISIDWNEPIRPEVAAHRVSDILGNISEPWQCHLGESQYLLNNFYDGKINGAEILLRYDPNSEPEVLKEEIIDQINHLHPTATVHIASKKTAFHMIFPERSNTLEIRCYLPQNNNSPENEVFLKYLTELKNQCDNNIKYKIPESDKSYLLQFDPENMLRYDIDHQSFPGELRRLLGQNEIAKISSFQYQLPVVVKGDNLEVSESLFAHMINNKRGHRIPLKSLVSLRTKKEPRTIFSGPEGAYVPIWIKSENPHKIEKKAKEVAARFPQIRLDVVNPDTQIKDTLQEILFALTASILLLYFLMAAQFESLILPIVLLLEIPISLAGSIYFLGLFGSSINVMSAIGMVVTIGVIINDSIIKIDTIHRFKRSGISTLESIHKGGIKRLNPIIMTSLTTILAAVPFLWGEDLGRMLQRPLALSLIGGMIVGTLVSLFVVPMLYEILEKVFPTIPQSIDKNI